MLFFPTGKFLLPFNLSAEVIEDHKTSFNAKSNIAILSRPLTNGRGTNLYLKFAAPTTTWVRYPKLFAKRCIFWLSVGFFTSGSYCSQDVRKDRVHFLSISIFESKNKLVLDFVTVSSDAPSSTLSTEALTLTAIGYAIKCSKEFTGLFWNL